MTEKGRRTPTPGARRRAPRAGSAAVLAVGVGATVVERREKAGGQVAMGEVELENLDAKLGRAAAAATKSSRTAAMPSSSSSRGTAPNGP